MISLSLGHFFDSVIDLSLYLQLFRVYYDCIDLDHILALASHCSSLRLSSAATMPAVCLQVIVNSCMKYVIKSQKTLAST